MSIRFTVLALMLAAFTFLFGVSSLASEPMNVVVSGPYPPFVEFNEDGSIYGFDKDIAEAICKELGKECIISNIEFDEIIPALLDGRVDFAVAGMGVNEERKKLIDFTDRYYRSVSIFIERKGSFTDIKPEEVKGMRIAAQTASLQADYLEKTYGDSITMVTDASYDVLYNMLRKKEVDLVFSDGLPGYSYLMSDAGQDFENIGAPIDPGNEVNWSRIALAKNKDTLREGINKALENLRRSGEYDKINRQYFDSTIY